MNVKCSNDSSNFIPLQKNERFWVVFCVHDDCEALLEGYSEPRAAPSHAPDWIVSLQNTMHISHTLVGSEHEFEFVITSQLEVFRFSAPSWDCMKEWVEALRSKLREMKIISPKENVYSRLPESRLPLLPTRDPTSPLPLPPASALPALVPGVEIVQLSSGSATTPIPSPPINNPFDEPATTNVTTTTDPISDNQPESLQSVQSESANSFILSAPPLSNTTSRSIMNLLSNPIQTYRSENQPSTSKAAAAAESMLKSQQEPISLAKIFTDNVLSKSPSDHHQGSSRFDFVNLMDECHAINENVPNTSTPLSREKILKIPRPQTTKTKPQTKEEVTISSLNSNGPTDGTGSTNITIIQLMEPTNEPKDNGFFVIPADVVQDTFNVQIIPSNEVDTNLLNDSATAASRSASQNVTVVATDHKTNVQLHAGAPNAAALYTKPIPRVRDESTKKILFMPSASNFNAVTNISVNEIDSSSPASPSLSNLEYEPIFIKPASTSVPAPLNKSSTIEMISSNPGISRHRSLGNSTDIKTHPSAVIPQPQSIEPKQSRQLVDWFKANNHVNWPIQQNPTIAVVPSVAHTPRNLPVLMRRGMTELNIKRTSRIDRHQNRLEQPSTSKRAEMKATIENLRKETQEQRRRSSSTSDIQTNRGSSEQHKSPTARAIKPSVPNTPPHVPRLTLREQQVMHLRTEMMHPGGVRLQLRRKECIGSIGFVDAFGAVW